MAADVTHPKWRKHECDVCSLLDNDTTEKNSYYCEVCKAWICDSCEYRLDRRARAMLKRKTAPQPGCNGCGKSQTGSVPAWDHVQGKSVGQMSYEERLRYDLRLRSESIMKWQAPLHVKRQKIQELEREYDTAVRNYRQMTQSQLQDEGPKGEL